MFEAVFVNFCNKKSQKALVLKKMRNINSRYDIINIRICIYVFKLNEIAVKIKQTNPPDKSENCLAKTLSSLGRKRTNFPLLRERVRVRGQSKTSFPLQTRKEGGVNRIGSLSPLQIGKDGGANTISLSSLLQAWK